LQKDLTAKEQALRASAEVKESSGRNSPLWLIPTHDRSISEEKVSNVKQCDITFV